MKNSKLAVITYGSPGAGKGTQAELIAKKLGLIHFDTGWHLKSILYSKEAENDPILKKEKDIHNAGTLNTPEWVLEIVKKESEKIARAGKGIVYSGSPRTIFEVEGDKENEGLMEVLEREYGKDNIYIFKIEITDEEASKRNMGRMSCGICKLPILKQSDNAVCSFCAGPAKKRPDDDPSVMENRLNEYKTRTEPILEVLIKRGYEIAKIDGSPAPYKVHSEIMKHLEGTITTM